MLDCELELNLVFQLSLCIARDKYSQHPDDEQKSLPIIKEIEKTNNSQLCYYL